MASQPNLNDGTWVVVGTGELDAGLPEGDGIFLQNLTTDEVVLWQLTGGEVTAKIDIPSVDGYTAISVADFDGDGLEDVYFRNGDPLGSQTNYAYLSSTGALTNVGEIRGTYSDLWEFRATADFNNDGTNDLVFQHVSKGDIFIRQIVNGQNGALVQFASGFDQTDNLLAAYNSVDLDSFDALWHDISLNQYDTVTYVNGALSIDDTFTVLAGQEFQSSGDFTGDSYTDFLFVDGAGSNAGSVELVATNQFNLEFARFTYQAARSAFGTNLEFTQSGDFDGDGTMEIATIDPATGHLVSYDVTAAISGISTETLSGSSGNDAINGNFGNDRILGFGGDDLLLGDGNNDVLLGMDGNDRLFGGDDEDAIFGGAGNDEIDSGAGQDLSAGGAGDDLIFSHQGSGNGTSFADGNDGDDYLLTGEGGHLRGGAGNDFLQSVSNNAILQGDEGDDYLLGSGSSDRMFGGDGNDFLLGDAGQDTLFGGNGDDILIGNTRTGASISTDTFYGGSGRDYFYLGNGDIGFYEGTGAAVISDYSTSVTSGDFLMLEGVQSKYTFTDTGTTIEIDVASTANLVAIIETTATVAQLQETIIYI